MKIFITGITGFIGQSLFEFYNNSNHHIKGYLRGENLINSLNEFNPDVIINCAGEIYNIWPEFINNKTPSYLNLRRKI